MLSSKYAQGTLIKDKWLQDWYCSLKVAACFLTAASSYCSLVQHLLMFQPVHHAPAVCLLYLVMHQVKGETGQDERNTFWFSELATNAVIPGPSVSVLFWFMLSSPYLFSGLSSRGPGETSLSWIFGAGLRALTCCKHTLALTRLVSLPLSLSPKMDCQSGSETENCWNIYTSDHYEVCHVITHAHIILAPICVRAPARARTDWRRVWVHM